MSPPDAERPPAAQRGAAHRIAWEGDDAGTEYPNQVGVTDTTMISTALIDPDPEQPRKHFDPEAHTALVASIQSEGLLQPIAVRRSGDRFVIVYGERRFRAVTNLGWTEIPAVELSRDNAVDLLVTQLIENLTRSDLHPIEEAHAYRRLIEAGVTATEIAAKVNKSKSYISHKLALLGLPDPLGIYLKDGVLSEGQIRQLARLKGFYGDLTKTYIRTEPAPDLHTWPDVVAIPAGVISMRPLDCPPGYHIPDFEKASASVIARSSRALIELFVREPTQPAWLQAVWWYATILVSVGGTVADARTLVERHMDSVVSAAVMVLLHGDDPERWPDQDGWLYLSDLRHAAMPTDLDGIKAWLVDRLGLVHDMVGDDEHSGTGIAAPSARQVGSPQHEAEAVPV